MDVSGKHFDHVRTSKRQVGKPSTGSVQMKRKKNHIFDE